MGGKREFLTLTEVNMDSRDLKQKKMLVISLKGGLKFLEEIRDTVRQRIESVNSKINELTDEIRQQEGKSH